MRRSVDPQRHVVLARIARSVMVRVVRRHRSLLRPERRVGGPSQGRRRHAPNGPQYKAGASADAADSATGEFTNRRACALLGDMKKLADGHARRPGAVTLAQPGGGGGGVSSKQTPISRI